MTGYWKYIIIVCVLLLIIIGIICISEGKIRVFNPGYWYWVHFGGEFKKEYDTCINLDVKRNQIVFGKNEQELEEWVGKLYGSSEFPDGYRNEAINSIKNWDKYKGKNAEVYFLDKNNGFGWCIILVNNKAHELALVKG